MIRLFRTRYICQATRIIEMTRLIHKAPFLVANLENQNCLMTELPDNLYIGEYMWVISCSLNKFSAYISFSYSIIAGVNNTSEHFTAIIKVDDNTYYRFNDVHPSGCFIYDGLIKVELAVYGPVL